MAWSFNPVPRRLMQDVRVLVLDPHDRAVLLSLYVAADEHGRFQAHEITLAVTLGMVSSDWSPWEAFERLCRVGLVHSYAGPDGQCYGQIDRWDDDLGADHKGKRPRSTQPCPPREVWDAAKCDGRHRGGRHEPSDEDATVTAERPASDQRPDTVRTPPEPRSPKEGRKERTKVRSDLKRASTLAAITRSDDDAKARREQLITQARKLQEADDGTAH